MCTPPLGIRANLNQFIQLLLQVLFVGFTLGTMRTVVPTLAFTEFGLQKNSYVFLTTFVVAFGIAKAILNFVSGDLTERFGRKYILILGWLFALPIPLVIYLAQSWWSIVFATLLLGINQGLTWSVTQTSKLDIALYNERGFAIGMNEAAGYIGLALGGLISAYFASLFNSRLSLLILGISTTLIALLFSVSFIKDTLPWALKAKKLNIVDSNKKQLILNYGRIIEIFKIVSWKDKRLMAVCQAGLIEKFVDAVIWIMFPILLKQTGISLENIGVIVAVYGLVWGLLQPIFGIYSDKFGRHRLCVLGIWICAVGVALITVNYGKVFYCISAAITGIGMAMLYPNLSATVADIADESWRASAIGIYRFWRDIGYSIGALGIGITIKYSNSIDFAFWFVSASMFISGLILLKYGSESLLVKDLK